MESLSTESSIRSKLNKLLDLFLQPEYKIKNDVYISTLLTHIKDTKDRNRVLQSDIFSEWILRTVAIWEANGVKTDPLITSFLLNVLSELSQNDSYYTIFKNSSTYDRLLKVMNVTATDIPHIVKLGYVRVFKALLTHCDGLKWLRETCFWKSILDLNESNATIYLNRETQDVLNELLKKTAAKNLEFCHEVISKIVDSLISTDQVSYCSESDTFTEVNQDEFYKKVISKLMLLNYILEDILCNSQNSSDFEIIKICSTQFPLKQCILNYMNIVNHKQFVYDLSKLLIALELYNLFLPVEYSDILRNNLDILKINLSKQYFDNVYKLCNAVFILSIKILDKRTSDIDEKGRNYLNQLLAVQLLPLLMVPKVQSCQRSIEYYAQDDCFHRSLTAVLPINYIVEMNEFLPIWQHSLALYVQEIQLAIGVLSHLMKSKTIYILCDAKILNNCLICIMKDLTEVQKASKCKMSTNLSMFLIQILEASCSFCSDFDIFNDYRDTLRFIEQLMKLFELPISNRITEKVLKLMNITITQYFIPHKTRLEEEVYNAIITSVIPLLHSKLSADAWEVRDSTLEVFTSVVNLIDSRFPLLQKTLTDLQIPRYILTKAVYDNESFVRVTGCQCLTAMTKIDEFWRDLDEPRDLINCLIQTFDNEDEGIVRKEIITAIREVHHSRQITTEALYDVMIKAVYDFYWEVKMEALQFWEMVVRQYLDVEGLFRTIHSEDNTEPLKTPAVNIIEKVYLVLKTLSESGCLKVLVDAVQDDCDIEVAKFTFNIIHNFKELFCRHGLTAEPFIALESRNTSESSGEQLQDKRARTMVKPSEFILFVQQDFSAIIEDRKKWLKGIDELDSLLNDMLKNYEDEFNAMDCY